MADLAMTRWFERPLHPVGPLAMVCPEVPPARSVDRMLDPFDGDIARRPELPHSRPMSGPAATPVG